MTEEVDNVPHWPQLENCEWVEVEDAKSEKKKKGKMAPISR